MWVQDLLATSYRLLPFLLSRASIQIPNITVSQSNPSEHSCKCKSILKLPVTYYGVLLLMFFSMWNQHTLDSAAFSWTDGMTCGEWAEVCIYSFIICEHKKHNSIPNNIRNSTKSNSVILSHFHSDCMCSYRN